jgi:hypothetical protein
MCHHHERLKGLAPRACSLDPLSRHHSHSHLRCVAYDGPDLEEDDAATDGPRHPSVHDGPLMSLLSARHGPLLSTLVKGKCALGPFL